MSDSVPSETSPQVVLTGESAPPASGQLPDTSQVLADGWPTRTPAIGRGSRGPQYQAVVRQSVLDAIHGHGKSCTGVEVCGVLVGNVYQDEFGPYLHVNSCIRGDRAKGHAAQVTFTAETWSAIQATMDQEHADERIIGWYHTHPGFGIFLSGMDLFIQDHFFNLPWQVAFVYDPIGGDEGMFYWKEGKADRQSFLIEADSLLLTSDHLSREPAQTLAEMEAAEVARPATTPASTTPVLPAPTPPTEADYSSWSGVRAMTPRKSIIPMWVLGAAAFVVSFGCTMWAMFSINHDIVVIPHHVDQSTTQQATNKQATTQHH